MNLPCPTCERKSECIRDRRCNRPTGVEVAMKELRTALEAMQAAVRRVNEAAAAVHTAIAIDKGQQP